MRLGLLHGGARCLHRLLPAVSLRGQPDGMRRVSPPSSGSYSSLGPAHQWGPRDSHGRQECGNCGVWKMSPKPECVYYSRTSSLTGTWSVLRPECRKKDAA